MALGSPPMQEAFTPVVSNARPKYSKRYMLIVGAGTCAVAVMALAAVAAHGRSSELMQGSDETMHGWEEGMYPPNAVFPAGYAFGDGNVFGKNSKFGAGDTFGDKNVFGKGAVFGAGVTIGDNNNFGKDQTFGPGLRMGNRELIGRRSHFATGSMLGDENQIGRKVTFGRRVTIGQDNQFGFDDEFGSNDQLGMNNQYGRGDTFGSKILFYKNQEFGPRNAFHSDEYLNGGDEFGSRDWGLDTEKLPASDKEEWTRMQAKHPDWFPNRAIRDKTVVLHSQAANVQQKKMALREVARVAKASQIATAETERLQKVIKELSEK
jgi:hypothetical protein